MSNFGILLKKDLLEILRNRKWLVYLITFLIIVVISVATARLLPELLNLIMSSTGIEETFTYKISVGDSYSQFISNMGQVGLLLIMIMFSTSLAKEKINGTYQLLKSNGVKDSEIVLSHFIAKLILITLAYLASVLVFVALNLVVFKEYTGYRGLVALTYLYLVLVFGLSLALFISSFAKKKSHCYILVIGIYFILSILSVFPYIDVYVPLTGLNLANDYIVHQFNYEQKDYLINLFMNIGLIIVLVISSIYLYKNRIDNKK